MHRRTPKELTVDPILVIAVVFCTATVGSLVQLPWTWRLSRRIRAWLSDERTPLDIASFATFSRVAMAVWIVAEVLALFSYLQVLAQPWQPDGGDVMALSVVLAIWCLIQLIVSRMSDAVCQLTQRFAATRGLAENGQLEEAAKLLPEGVAPLGVSQVTLSRRLSLERVSLIWQSVLLGSVALGVAALMVEVLNMTAFGGILLLGMAVIVPGIIVVVVVRFAVETRARRAQFLWFLTLTTQKERPLAAELLAWGKSHPGKYGTRVAEVARDLAVGEALADALQAQTKLLAPSDLLTIRVAEQTGTLPGSLRDLAVRRTNELKGDPFSGVAIGTCLMLWMVLTVGCNIVGFLMYFIVPKFKSIFMGFGTELPGITVLLISASDFVVNSGVLIVLPPLSLLLLWTCGEAFFRGWSETWLAWLVGTGRRAEVPRMLRRLRNAVVAHQPWPVALKPMVLNHHRPGMRVRLERVLGRVTAGISIWPSMRDAGLLSARDVGLLEMAERANNLEWALAALAEAKERALKHRWRVILTIAAPVFTISAGLFVFFVCIGFFMPLVKLLNDLS